MFISLKLLKGPLGRVKEENPLLFRKFTAECQKLGFPEIIRPCKCWTIHLHKNMLVSRTSSHGRSYFNVNFVLLGVYPVYWMLTVCKNLSGWDHCYSNVVGCLCVCVCYVAYIRISI